MAQASPLTPFVTPVEQDRIVTAWFIRQRHQWCVTALSVLIDLDPETAWAIVVRLVLEAPDDPTLVNVAGGPLEALLAKHGAKLVNRAEQLARVSPEFRYALRKVWLPNDQSPAAERLETLGCQCLIFDELERKFSS